MNLKIYAVGIFVAFCSIVVNATEIYYSKIVGLRGLLTERQGFSCCTDGKEKRVSFPVIELRSPVNVLPINSSKPEADEIIEIGVMSMQLVMNEETWKIYKKLKGKSARVLCLPYHAINGHHMTSVLCEVKSIDDM